MTSCLSLQVPFSKLLTFFRRSPFTLQAEYSAPHCSNNRFIGAYTISDVAPTADGSSQKVSACTALTVLSGILFIYCTLQNS